jgi:iron(II)-dependent oxidoreductase
MEEAVKRRAGNLSYLSFMKSIIILPVDGSLRKWVIAALALALGAALWLIGPRGSDAGGEVGVEDLEALPAALSELESDGDWTLQGSTPIPNGLFSGYEQRKFSRNLPGLNKRILIVRGGNVFRAREVFSTEGLGREKGPKAFKSMILAAVVRYLRWDSSEDENKAIDFAEEHAGEFRQACETFLLDMDVEGVNFSSKRAKGAIVLEVQPRSTLRKRAEWRLKPRQAASEEPEGEAPPAAEPPPAPAPPAPEPAAGKAGMEWVRIPGGSFRMGDEDFPDARPCGRSVRSFWLAKTEATVAQYKACVADGACSEPGTGPDCNWGVPGRESHPADCLDFAQAEAFAKWAGGRLPSEAEWEYAARSGGKDRKFPWGDEEAGCARAVVARDGDGCGKGSTWPVCSKPEGNSEQGLCDMAGNVWEWVQDYYHDSYEGGPSDGRAWESPAGAYRVQRGGSADRSAAYARAAIRFNRAPGNGQGLVGVRPAKDAGP